VARTSNIGWRADDHSDCSESSQKNSETGDEMATTMTIKRLLLSCRRIMLTNLPGAGPSFACADESGHSDGARGSPWSFAFNHLCAHSSPLLRGCRTASSDQRVPWPESVHPAQAGQSNDQLVCGISWWHCFAQLQRGPLGCRRPHDSMQTLA